MSARWDRERKLPSFERHDRITVDGYERSFDGAEVNGEIGRGAGVDDAQPHLAVPLYVNHVRISECPLVGKIGVVVDVVQVRL
jgi:hypothetical protein